MQSATYETATDSAITVIHLGERLELEEGAATLTKEYGAQRYRDAYFLKFSDGEAWLFTYGVLVTWNLSEATRKDLCNALGKLFVSPVQQRETEHYRYRFSEQGEFKVQHDLIYLDDQDTLCRLALSHAFAQSCKLDFFEQRAQEVIEQNRYLSKQLATKGSIPLNRKQLAQLQGVLFDTRSDIVLHFNLLDTPEFFWDYPEREHYYHTLSKYLDLKPRIDLLNQKLDTIRELLEMLTNEQHHKHSAFLEWVIIILIAVDILVYALPGH